MFPPFPIEAGKLMISLHHHHSDTRIRLPDDFTRVWIIYWLQIAVEGRGNTPISVYEFLIVLHWSNIHSDSLLI